MSAFATAMLVTGLFVAAGIIVLAATMGSLDPHDRKVIARRVGWILLGAAGMPAMLFGPIELVGLPIALVAFVVGLLVANRRRIQVGMQVVYGLVLAFGVAAAADGPSSVENGFLAWRLGV
jgi:hypothetical protein